MRITFTILRETRLFLKQVFLRVNRRRRILEVRRSSWLRSIDDQRRKKKIKKKGGIQSLQRSLEIGRRLNVPLGR